jgi:hypothetical protein
LELVTNLAEEGVIDGTERASIDERCYAVEEPFGDGAVCPRDVGARERVIEPEAAEAAAGVAPGTAPKAVIGV